MKTIKVFAFALMVGVLANACKYVTEKKISQNLPPAEFKQYLEQKRGICIDLRIPEKYFAEKIEGSLNVDLTNDQSKKTLDILDKKQYYFLYCDNGELNRMGYELLKENGFKNVYKLDGGFERWKNEGMPVDFPDPELMETKKAPICVGVKPIIDYTDPKVDYIREISVFCDTSYQVVTRMHEFTGVGKFTTGYAYNKELKQKINSVKNNKNRKGK